MRARGDDQPTEPGGNSAQRPVAAVSAHQAETGILAGLTRTSPPVRAVAAAIAALVDAANLGQLGTAAQLADDLAALARAGHVLAAETARRAHAADTRDVTVTGVTSTLAQQQWSPRAARTHLRAGAFAQAHPDLLSLWRAARTSVDTVAAIAAGTRTLSAADTASVVAWLLPVLPDLDTARVKLAVAAAVDRLQPDETEQRERRAHDNRYLSWSRYRDHVLIEARLPALEGEAFLAAVHAYAEKLRVEGDQLTAAQRRADALAAITAALAAAGTIPRRNGQPAAATILISLTEAERLTAGAPRVRLPLPDLTPPAAGGPGTSSRPDCPRGGPFQHFTDLPMTPGLIGQRHTLGDAAARMVLCSCDVTGALVSTGYDHSENGAVAALLAGAPLEPLALGRAQRFATPAQRKALELRDRGCVIPGCGIDTGDCQAHHTTDWAHGGTTDLDTLALLCWPHHRQVDVGKWTLLRNADRTGPHWLVAASPRDQWRRRQ